MPDMGNVGNSNAASRGSAPIELDTTPPAAPLPERSFEQLGVPAPIIAALKSGGVTEPFAIQNATLPDSIAGRDLLGRGRTGSGKTLAFAIPLVTVLANSGAARKQGHPRGLVLVPTRELANQVTEVLAPLAAAMKLTYTTIFGGVGQNPQVNALRKGVDIVVACPGRLEDLIAQGHCRLSAVEVAVLDEADHMADLGFLPGVKRILDATPPDGQRLLFSATLDNGIDVLVRRYLSHPVVHSVDPAVAEVSTMTHHVFCVSAGDKASVVRELAAGQERSLLFMRTKHGAKKLAQVLTKSGIPAAELHGNLSQGARERNLASFSEGTTRVLVATDIAARGIHVDDIALVVHVDPPAEHKAYVHRSGRTARAGNEGVVVTIMTPEQRKDVNALTKAAKITPILTDVSPGHNAIGNLVGEPAEFVAPAPIVVRTQPAPRAKPSSPSPHRGRGPVAAGPRGGASTGGGSRTGGASRSPGASGNGTAQRQPSARQDSRGQGRPASAQPRSASSAPKRSDRRY